MEKLEKINRFTRRELKEDEVYCFSVVLCDNEIDRDNEKFTVPALKKLAELFIGKTGIFSHDPRGENQTARIYDAEVIADESKKTADGEIYHYLKADAYMVRTASNEDLIKEIDGGIKKEVSVGCSVSKEVCSVCGKDIRAGGACAHRKGKSYGGKRCYRLLDDPTDAYEWSFVAVPAQRSAGVTKRFGNNSNEKTYEDGLLEEIETELKKDILSLSFMEGDSVPVAITKAAIEKMDIRELLEIKKALKKDIPKRPAEIEKALNQGSNDRSEASNRSFRI